MNAIKRLFILIAVFSIFCLPALADSPPEPLAPDRIKIDGDAGDWAGINAFMGEFGLGKKEDGQIDVKSLHMGFSQDAFFFKAVLDPSPSSVSPNEDLSILQLIFDSDSNDVTGNMGSKVYKVVPKGFETRFELVLTKNKELVGRMYSSDDSFNKLITEWKTGSDNLGASGSTIEFKVPYSMINFKSSQGAESIRILFAEFANMTSKEGYSKQVIKLDFGAIKQGKAVATKSDATSSEGGFSIFHLIVLTIWIVSILCGFAIAPKAGLSTGLAAVNLVPFLGQLIFLFVLAFGEWPLHKDYQKLEDRLREFDEEI